MNKEFARSKCQYCRKEYEKYIEGAEAQRAELMNYIAEIAEKGLTKDKYETKVEFMITMMLELKGESELWYEGYQRWLKEIQK